MGLVQCPQPPLLPLQRRACRCSPDSRGVGCPHFLCLKFSHFSEAEKQQSISWASPETHPHPAPPRLCLVTAEESRKGPHLLLGPTQGGRKNQNQTLKKKSLKKSTSVDRVPPNLLVSSAGKSNLPAECHSDSALPIGRSRRAEVCKHSCDDLFLACCIFIFDKLISDMNV